VPFVVSLLLAFVSGGAVTWSPIPLLACRFCATLSSLIVTLLRSWHSVVVMLGAGAAVALPAVGPLMSETLPVRLSPVFSTEVFFTVALAGEVISESNGGGSSGLGVAETI